MFNVTIAILIAKLLHANAKFPKKMQVLKVNSKCLQKCKASQKKSKSFLSECSISWGMQKF